MVTLDELLDSGEAKHRASAAQRQALEAIASGFYWLGFGFFRLLRLLLLVIGGFFWVLGWSARRIVWPALTWIAAAVRVGWEDAHRSGARVPR